MVSKSGRGKFDTYPGGGPGDIPRRLAALPNDGGVYVAGNADGQFPGKPAAASGHDFLARFDASGNLLWLEQSESLDMTATWDGYAVDGLGNFYGVAFTYFTPRHHELYKVSPAGTEFWRRPARDNFYGDPSRLAVNDDGTRIYQSLSTGSAAAIITLSDGQGCEIWAKRIQFGHSVVIDPVEGTTWNGSAHLYNYGLPIVDGDQLYLMMSYQNRYQFGSVPIDPYDDVLIAALNGETGDVERARQYRTSQDSSYAPLALGLASDGTLHIAGYISNPPSDPAYGDRPIIVIDPETLDPIN